MAKFKLNPDDKQVQLIKQGLFKKETKYGNAYCPCVTPSAHNEDTICPCKEYRESSICKCKLYIE